MEQQQHGHEGVDQTLAPEELAELLDRLTMEDLGERPVDLVAVSEATGRPLSELVAHLQAMRQCSLGERVGTLETRQHRLTRAVRRIADRQGEPTTVVHVVRHEDGEGPQFIDGPIAFHRTKLGYTFTPGSARPELVFAAWFVLALVAVLVMLFSTRWGVNPPPSPAPASVSTWGRP